MKHQLINAIALATILLGGLYLTVPPENALAAPIKCTLEIDCGASTVKCEASGNGSSCQATGGSSGSCYVPGEGSTNISC